MANRLARLLILAPLVGGVFAVPARAYIADDRWTTTATNGFVGSVNSVGVPVTLTWSIARDGALLPGNPNPAAPNDPVPPIASNLISFLDARFSVPSNPPPPLDFTTRPWFTYFQQSFDRISALSGVTYVYEPADSTTAFSEFGATGSLGVRGDVRLGGKSYGVGSNVLASNFFPNYGEMMINTDQGTLLGNSTSSYLRLRNTVMHEAMHGLGISHVDSTAAFLIEPVSTLSFDGPQLDDVLALQRLYGDAFEKNGGNDAFTGATQLGTLTATQSLLKGTLGDTTAVAATATDFLSIDDDSDTDYFKFTLNEPLDVSILLTPKGTTYSVGQVGGTQSPYNSLAASNLSLALFDVNGTSQLGATANVNGAGAGESIYRHLNPGQYYARVRGAEDEIQLYQIAILSGFVGAPPLQWIGNVSNVWDAVTPNFFNGTTSDVFHNQIDVTFDDAAVAKTVEIPTAVSAGDVLVNTVTNFVFTGPAGIVEGSLTIDGSGVVEFANSGNSYGGPTTVFAGTLKITGNANAMVSAITVADGATLVLDASDASTMASSITVQAGGELQIGTLTSAANVLADNAAGIVNNGTIRVFDDEEISHVSGSGEIVVEHDSANLANNSGFDGAVTIKNGAVAELLDSSALGNASGTTTVESGGRLLVTSASVVLDDLTIAGTGLGHGALHVNSSQNVLFFGGLTGHGEDATVAVGGGASAIIFGDVTSTSTSTPLFLRVDAGSHLTMSGQTNIAAGGLTKSGDGMATFAGAATLNGPTVVADGTLRLIGAGALTGQFQVADGALLEVAGSHAFAPTAKLTGSGEVSGNIVMPGTVSPGPDADVLTLLNGLTLTATSVVDIDLGGSLEGTEFDRLVVGGAAQLDGELRVSLINGFNPAAHDSFSILTASQILGSFDSVDLPDLDPGLIWDVSYASNQLLLSISASVTYDPADFNDDGNVDGDDFAAWKTGFGASTGAMREDGDSNGDSAVDGVDFLAWQRGFSNEPAVLAAATFVPEPTATAALFSALMCLAARWRRNVSVR